MTSATKKTGIITSFDRETCYGQVLAGDALFRFHSTFFHGGRPARWPRLGEEVELVFSDNRLVEVRAVT